MANLTDSNSTWINNSTKSDSPGNSVGLAIALSLANIISITVGSWGNLLVVIVVVCNRGLHSSTNFFIASLACADLLITAICMPVFYVYNVLTWPVWHFGSAVCKISSYLVHTSVMASALSLLAISYDRFVSICFPMKTIMTIKRAKLLVAAIWFVSPILLFASLLHHDVVPMKYKGQDAFMCVETWDTKQELHRYQMYRISCYFLFLLQISVLYLVIGCRLYKREPPGAQTMQGKAKLNNEKKKIIKMLFSVVLLFALSWLLYIINKLLNIFPPSKNYEAPDVFVFVGNFLGLLNSVINPIVYAALNRNFRTAFKHAIRCNCKYEAEERRRTQSVVSLRNTQQTRDRKCSESYVSRRASESTSFEFRKNSVINGFDLVTDVQDDRQPRCLTIDNSEVNIANERNRKPSVPEKQNYTAKRKVSFGPEIMDLPDAASSDHNDENDDITNRRHSRSRGNSITSYRLHSTSTNGLDPIEESFHQNEDESKDNKGFEYSET
ncbi:dopamine receptor 2-like [Actinia tenebrosa]|uniref:Dopamine receptor 2-like n=1 Tax=Actinia tenebrosa TaxID=6105 RepID=A0A6P8HVJ8_ACTTE|nr:dopamine receptor 2-like [Actinia tenebrosa]XP_031559390.1 dopamine receptor 2-like [Actinia tenebrosa]XP_031559391.1 dopamine receptor 2-like [Actinia tenebrosa]XP_031559392.1 dopamine receptor 2-like [Actinia tenebrosa]XP_031559393.1 dopamine receptor 2-like [Actinia tenebrosa]XP_031559396.1 dopamine receptor 2-like [Actinia tenebrosa]